MFQYVKWINTVRGLYPLYLSRSPNHRSQCLAQINSIDEERKEALPEAQVDLLGGFTMQPTLLYK